MATSQWPQVPAMPRIMGNGPQGASSRLWDGGGEIVAPPLAGGCSTCLTPNSNLKGSCHPGLGPPISLHCRSVARHCNEELSMGYLEPLNQHCREPGRYSRQAPRRGRLMPDSRQSWGPTTYISSRKDICFPPPGEASGGVFGQQQRMEAAGRISELYQFCLHHITFMKKYLPAFFNICLAPNCVLTFLQWRGQR